MDKENRDSLVRAEKAVIAERIERLIIYEGERPVTAGDMFFACRSQIESVIQASRYKYDASLYVKRDIEQELNFFFDSSPDGKTPNSYVLIAPAGSGKTNLLCHLAQERIAKQPTILLMGGSLYLSGTAGLLGSIRNTLEQASPQVFFRSDADSLHTLHRLGEELDRDVLILLDAINEYDHPIEMRKALEEILRITQGKRAKLLITCRDYYWGLFKGEYWEGATFNNLPVDEQEKEDKSSFNLFTNDAYKKALALYLEHYSITGEPVGDCNTSYLPRHFVGIFKV